MDELIKRLERIESKVDKVDSRLDKHDIHLAVYNEQLKIHITGVQDARKENEKSNERITKVENKVSMAEGALKFIGLFAVVVGLVVGVIEVIQFLKP